MRFLKKLKTRRKFRRRFKGLFKKSISQKYMMVCFIANNKNLPTDKNTLLQVFLLCIQKAMLILRKATKILGNFVITLLKRFGKYMLRYKWVVAYFFYLALAGVVLLKLYKLSKKFNKKISLYQWLLLIIMWLLIIYLSSLIIKGKSLQTLLDFLKSVSFKTLATLDQLLDQLNDFLDLQIAKPSKDLQEATNINEISQNNRNFSEFKNFIIVTILTILTTKYLLFKFKSSFIPDNRFKYIIIQTVDADPLNFDRFSEA